ncbi:MAG: hypothetical protein EA391_10545 [Balneolaceae bacterium]|nr:MAG: hypothetical protein EA391_10545 [Balneolaceae bacterium]
MPLQEFNNKIPRIKNSLLSALLYVSRFLGLRFFEKINSIDKLFSETFESLRARMPKSPFLDV